MKVAIEVEIPDGALLSEWIAVVRYLPPEGESATMTLDCSAECSSVSRIGMLVQAADYQRRIESESWT